MIAHPLPPSSFGLAFFCPAPLSPSQFFLGAGPHFAYAFGLSGPLTVVMILNAGGEGSV